MRLYHVIIKLSKPLGGIKATIERMRVELDDAQKEMLNYKMNNQIIEKMNRCIEKVIHLNDLEEQDLRKKAKIDWLRLDDGNDIFFHASLKAKKSKQECKLSTRKITLF